MRFVQTKMIRHIIDGQLRERYGAGNKALASDITTYIQGNSMAGPINLQAGIIRLLDGQYGVSETNIQLGQGIYALIFQDDDA